MNFKVERHTGAKWFVHGPKHSNENHLLNVCKSDIKGVHGNLYNPFFEKKIW